MTIPCRTPAEPLLESPSLLISHRRDGNWLVWISLQDQDPILDSCGFIVGRGETRDAAVANAVAALENAVERLQAHAGAIEERDLDSQGRDLPDRRDQ